MKELGRADRRLISHNAGALDGEREENTGIANRIVVKEIVGACPEIIEIECPATHRNRQAHLMLFISLTVQRQEAKPLAGREIEKWSGDRT